MQGKQTCSVPIFPYALEIAQPNFTRKDAAAGGMLRTLSRIDGAFINVPMVEARDFYCHSQSIPSDHVAVRVVIRKPPDHCDTGKRIPSWMSNHLVFRTILKQISDSHRYPGEPFAAVAEFKQIVEKARKLTRHELLRCTPTSQVPNFLLRLQPCTRIGTDIWACSCTAARHGNRADNASTTLPSNVLTSMGWVTSLPASNDRTLLSERLQYTIYPGHRLKKTTPWTSAGLT